jgi:RNA polymerase sigma-70 factor (ECF subfamily)
MPATRHSLIAKLSEPANAAAWSEFLELYQDAIWRFARGCGLQDADAADVVQEVLLLVHQKIGQWRPSGRTGAFRCWLIKTAHRVCLRSIRNASRADRAVGGSSACAGLYGLAGDPPRHGSDSDWQSWAFCWAAGIVQREVDPVAWDAFFLNSVKGVSAADAAQRLGISKGNVYLAKCRIIARIRTVIGELSEGNS